MSKYTCTEKMTQYWVFSFACFDGMEKWNPNAMVSNFVLVGKSYMLDETMVNCVDTNVILYKHGCQWEQDSNTMVI